MFGIPAVAGFICEYNPRFANGTETGSPLTTVRVYVLEYAGSWAVTSMLRT